MSPTQSQLLGRILLISIAGSFFLYVWKNRSPNTLGSDIDLWALCLALMGLLNPATRPDYFIFLVPAVASVTQQLIGKRATLSSQVAFTLSVFLIAFTTQWVLGRSLNNLVESWRVPAIGICLLCAVLFGLVKKNRAEVLG